MMMRRLSILLSLLAVAACQPPRPVALPPPPPPPPAPSAEETAAEAAAHANRLWEEGTAMGRQGRWAQAEQSYRQAVALAPDSAKYPLAQAGALLQLGRDNDAANALQAAIRIEEAQNPVNHALVAVDYERLIQILERVGRLDEARTARERQRFHRMMRDAAP
jgi:tetratricopeptide (TPR) repeat protein